MKKKVNAANDGSITITTRDFEEEDRRILCYCGLLGHEYVGMYGRAGKRRSRVEANTMESAISSFEPYDENRAVYRKVAKKTWDLVWADWLIGSTVAS